MLFADERDLGIFVDDIVAAKDSNVV